MPPSASTKPIRFRMYAVRRKGPYFTVHIFRDRAAMRSWAKINASRFGGPVSTYRVAEAAVHSWNIHRLSSAKWSRSEDTGWIVFHRKRIGAGIVSHEMTHAALYYLMLWRPQLFRVIQRSRRADEALAWVQGWLVTQFWREFFRRGMEK